MKKLEKNEKSRELIEYLQKIAIETSEHLDAEIEDYQYAQGVFDGKKMLAQLILDRLIEVEFGRDYSRALKKQMLEKTREIKRELKEKQTQDKLTEREAKKKASPRFQTFLKREENRKLRAVKAAQAQVKKLEKQRAKVLKMQEAAKKLQEKEVKLKLKQETNSQKEAKRLLRQHRIQNTSVNCRPTLAGGI